jgi:hypothetical protein
MYIPFYIIIYIEYCNYYNIYIYIYIYNEEGDDDERDGEAVAWRGMERHVRRSLGSPLEACAAMPRLAFRGMCGDASARL